MSSPRRRRLIPALLIAVALAACAGDPADDPTTSDEVSDAATEQAADATEATDAPADDSTSEPDEPSEDATADADVEFPVTVSHDLGELTLDDRPGRIVSMSPAATEMLFAMGAGDQVVATDSLSTWPPEAPSVEDLAAFTPSVEAIAEFDPDLVVVSADLNDSVAGLGAIGIPVLQYGSAPTIADAYTQMAQLGVATGNAAGAAQLVADIRSDLAELADGTAGEGLTYYHELSTDLYSVTSSTFIGEVYGLFGLTSIADPADEDGSAFGFPQLSAEYLVEQDPDLVFLACTVFCGEDAESFAAREGFDQLTAVQQGRVVELDDDVASRWGPRIVDFAEAIAAALTAIE